MDKFNPQSPQCVQTEILHYDQQMSAQANRKSKITKFLYDLYGNQHKT